MEVPHSLRSWFVAHAAFAFVAAVPLLAVPTLALHRLGWTAVDPVTTRLVGAALLALAAASLSASEAGVEVCRALLRLNLVWSCAAAGALLAGIGAGAPPSAWAFLSIFIALTGVWFHQVIRFRQLERAAALDDPSGPSDEPPEDPT